jgi:hypothetical protein
MWVLVIGNIVVLFLLALAAAGISVTISWSVLFNPVRMWLFALADKSKIADFLADVISCHYCLGHYVALAFFIVCPATALSLPQFMLGAYVINYFLLVAMTSFISTSLMILIHRLKNLQA